MTLKVHSHFLLTFCIKCSTTHEVNFGTRSSGFQWVSVVLSPRI